MNTTAAGRRLFGLAQTVASRRRVGATIALAAIALGAAACGGSSPSTTTTSGSSTTSTSGAGGNTTTTSAGGAASLSQLESKLASGEAATYVATYKITGATSTGTPTSGTFTLAHSGSNSLVAATEPNGSFEEITTGTTSIICSKSSSTGAWMCFGGSEVGSLGAGLTALTNVYGSKAALATLRAEAAKVSHLSESSSTIAGQSVNCWTYTSTTTSGTYTFCVTSAGVLAQLKGHSSNGNYEMDLQTYSTSVPSNEFTAPATVTTIPTGT